MHLEKPEPHFATVIVVDFVVAAVVVAAAKVVVDGVANSINL